MPNPDQTDLFEDDGVTLKAVEKPVITAEQLEAERRAAHAEGENAGLKAALKAIPLPKENAQPSKEFSRQELRAQVNDGKITEDQMDDILDAQREKKFAKLVDEKVETRVSASQTGAKVTDQIAAYVDVYPDINKDGSAVRAKVEAEFQALVKDGSPDSLATELAAIKIAMGPLKTGAGRRPAPDAHEDVGAGSDGDNKPADGWSKGLSPAMKKHYEKQINNGVYKGHTDKNLLAELKLVRSRAH